MDLFWNVRTTTRVLDAQALANQAPGQESIASQQRDESTNERVDQLLLVCAAMWELVKERTGATDQDLIDKVAILDAQDGVADGKLTYAPQKCPKCQRTVFPKHRRCLYCGADAPIDNVFKTI